MQRLAVRCVRSLRGHELVEDTGEGLDHGG
jgi:hypothetical protein